MSYHPKTIKDGEIAAAIAVSMEVASLGGEKGDGNKWAISAIRYLVNYRNDWRRDMEWGKPEGWTACPDNWPNSLRDIKVRKNQTVANHMLSIDRWRYF
ncbi:MAG TPA: hypothetical protein VGB30_05645 [bacterium]|jgi:hypothetical protein